MATKGKSKSKKKKTTTTVRTVKPQIIVAGPPAAPPRRAAPRKSTGGKKKGVKVFTQSVSTVAGGAVGGGAAYGIARLVEKESNRVLADGGVSLTGLALQVGGALTDHPCISHAGAAMHGAGLGAIGSEYGNRHRREAATKGAGASASTDGPGTFTIKTLFKLLRERLKGEGADDEEIAGFFGDVAEDVQTGAVSPRALEDAHAYLQADDLGAALAAIDGVDFEDVDVGGPREWIRKNRWKAKRKGRKDEKAADTTTKAALDQATGPSSFNQLIDPVLQRRIEMALA